MQLVLEDKYYNGILKKDNKSGLSFSHLVKN